MSSELTLHDYQLRGVEHLQNADARGGPCLAYRRMHERIIPHERGRATDQPCAGCGDTEKRHDWAYQYTAGDAELVCPTSGRTFSENVADYEALCRSCHVSFDLSMDSALAERRSKGGKKGGGLPKTAAHTAAVWRSRRANPDSSASFSKAMSETMTRTNARRVACAECSFVSNPAHFGKHRKVTGHQPKKGE